MKLKKLSDTFRDPEHGEKAVPLAPDEVIKREPLGDDEALNKAYLKKKEDEEEDGTQTDGGFDPSGDPPPPPPVTEEQDPPQLPESYRQSIGALGGAIAFAGGNMDTYGPDGAPDGTLDIYDALSIVDFWAQMAGQSPSGAADGFTYNLGNVFLDITGVNFNWGYGMFYNPQGGYDPATGDGSYTTFQDLLDNELFLAPFDWNLFAATGNAADGGNAFEAVFNAYQGDVPADFFETLLVNPNPTAEDLDDLGSWFDLNMLPLLNIYADVALYNMTGDPLGYSDNNLSQWLDTVQSLGGQLGLADNSLTGSLESNFTLSSFDVNGDGTFNGEDIAAWLDVTEMIQVVQAIQNGESVTISAGNGIYTQEDIDAIVEYYNYYGTSIGSGNLYFDTNGVWDDTQNINDISGAGEAQLDLIGIVDGPPLPPPTFDAWEAERPDLQSNAINFALSSTALWRSNYDIDWGQNGPDNFNAIDNLGAWWTDCMTWFYNYAQDMADGFNDGQYLPDSPALTFTLEDILTLDGTGGPLIFDTNWLAENNLTDIFNDAPWPDWMLPNSNTGFGEMQIATFMWMNYPFGLSSQGAIGIPGTDWWPDYFNDVGASEYASTVFNGGSNAGFLWGITSTEADLLFGANNNPFLLAALWGSANDPGIPNPDGLSPWLDYLAFVQWYNDGLDYGYITGGSGGYIEYIDNNGYPAYFITTGTSPYSSFDGLDNLTDQSLFVILNPPTLNESTPGSVWLENRPTTQGVTGTPNGTIAPYAYLNLMINTQQWRQLYDVNLSQNGNPSQQGNDLSTWSQIYTDSLMTQIFGATGDTVDSTLVQEYLDSLNEVFGTSYDFSQPNVLQQVENFLNTAGPTALVPGVPNIITISGFATGYSGNSLATGLIESTVWYDFITNQYQPPGVLDVLSDGTWTDYQLSTYLALQMPYGATYDTLVTTDIFFIIGFLDASFFDWALGQGQYTSMLTDGYEAFWDEYIGWVAQGFSDNDIADEFGFDAPSFTQFLNVLGYGYGYFNFGQDPSLEGHYDYVNVADGTVFYTFNTANATILIPPLGANALSLFDGGEGLNSPADSYSWKNWLRSANGLVDFGGDGQINFADWCHLWQFLMQGGGVVNNYNSGTNWQQFGLYDGLQGNAFFQNFGNGSYGDLSGYQLNWLGFGGFTPNEGDPFGGMPAWASALDSLVPQGGAFDAYLSFTGYSGAGDAYTGTYSSSEVGALLGITASFFYYWEAVQETQDTGSVPEWYTNQQAPPSFAPFASGDFDGVLWNDGGGTFFIFNPTNFGGGSGVANNLPTNAELLAYVDYLDAVGLNAGVGAVLDNDGMAINFQSNGTSLADGLYNDLISIANQNYIAAYVGNYNSGSSLPLNLDLDGDGVFDNSDALAWSSLQGFIENAVQNGQSWLDLVNSYNISAVQGGRSLIEGDDVLILGTFLWENGFFETSGQFGAGFFANDTITVVGDNVAALAMFGDILDIEYAATTLFNGLDGEQFAWGAATFYASATDGTYDVTIGSYAPGSPQATSILLNQFINSGVSPNPDLPFDLNSDGVFSYADVQAFASFIDLLNTQLGGDYDMISNMGLAGYDINGDQVFDESDIDQFTAFFGSFSEDGNLDSATMNLFGYFNESGVWIDFGGDNLLPVNYFGSDWDSGITYDQDYAPLPSFPLPPPTPTETT